MTKYKYCLAIKYVENKISYGDRNQNKVFKSSKIVPVVSSAASTGATTQQKPTMFTVQSGQETNT